LQLVIYCAPFSFQIDIMHIRWLLQFWTRKQSTFLRRKCCKTDANTLTFLLKSKKSVVCVIQYWCITLFIVLFDVIYFTVNITYKGILQQYVVAEYSSRVCAYNAIKSFIWICEKLNKRVVVICLLGVL